MNAGEILERIPEQSVLVLGDICLDRWCRYDPATSEPSRETGIPRIGVVRTEVSPGAAGTIANNLKALLAQQVSVLGVIGEDGFGVELQRALAARGISSDLAVHSSAVPTFTYTKLINKDTEEEDQPRVDFIYTEPMPRDVEDQIIERLRTSWASFDAILVCDQAETPEGGVVTPRVRGTLGELAACDSSKVVWADSRVRGEHFRNVILKSNVGEAEAACRRAFGGNDVVRLRRHTQSPLLVITDGSNGALLVDDKGPRRVPTKHVEHPVDICGAGDSFSAGTALALSITRSPEEAIRFGNMVASVTIMKKGTGVASPAEVLQAAATWPA
jgi:rfaE bifunctional protein kinase chain/domain